MTDSANAGISILARAFVRQFPEEAARHVESARLADGTAPCSLGAAT